MVHHITPVVEFAVLLTRNVLLLIPHYLVEAKKFNPQYPNPTKNSLAANKLRRYHHRKALLQRKVPDVVGIDRGTYIHYEEANLDYYMGDKLRKISAFLDVEVRDPMAEYNFFLYHYQSKQSPVRREALA